MYNEQKKLTFVMFTYLLMESSFKIIFCTRGWSEKPSPPIPGASSQWTRHGGRAIFAAQTRRAVFSPDKLLSLCFLFGLVFGGGWGGSWCLAFVLFCFVVLLGGSGFLLLLWEVMTNLHANGFLVKIWVLKIIFPSSKHFKTYFGLRKDKGMEEERSTSSLCY